MTPWDSALLVGLLPDPVTPITRKECRDPSAK